MSVPLSLSLSWSHVGLEELDTPEFEYSET
jgi:hypothetical protein